MTETTETETERQRPHRPFWVEAMERQRCRTAAELGIDPVTLKPLPREPRSALQLAAAHARALEGTDDLLGERDKIAFTAALAAG